jgi:osmoprotectant transport system permease protein
MIEALRDQLEFLPPYLSGHLGLTLLTLLLGSTLSISIGLLVCRAPRGQAAVLAVASVVQTIPGLALLAVMVPLLGRIGFLPALIALVLYSMLPILRNTVVGITGVDASAVEAARGLGMTEGQMLWKVQLPLAAPVMLAGLRTAAAWTVGMATLATPVGAQSLGNFIFSGLYTRNHAAILLGCAAAAALALILDGILRGIEWGVTGRRPGLLAGMAALLVALGAAGIPWPRTPGETAHDVVRVGAKPFTEQHILGELLALHLQRRTGRPVDLRTNLGSTVAFDALAHDQIDVYVDYSGTVWSTILKKGNPPGDGRSMLESLADELRDEHGVELVGELGFENAYCLAMRRARARELGVASLSDLRREAAKLSLGADMEFLGREEYADLASARDVRFGEVRAMDAALMYEALIRGEVDIISAYTTEGKIVAYDLLVLEDDLNTFPPYNAILLVSPSIRQMPDVVTELRELVGGIDDAAMLRANWSVDEEGHPARTVARMLLDRLPTYVDE